MHYLISIIWVEIAHIMSCDLLEENEAERLMASQEGVGRLFLNETDDYKVISTSVSDGSFC